jgi:AcrR family transcriptional regulator
MLTSERIVAAAIAVADGEGLAAISMRRVASDLGAATMSLYRHVADKDDLVTRMIDAAFAERTPPTDLPTDPSGDWRRRLELAAHTLWSMFHRHPWLAPAMSVTRPQLTASVVPFTEGVLTALDGRGLDPPTMLTIHLTLFTYVRGTAINIAMEADAEADSGLDHTAWEEGQQQAMRSLMASGRYPRFARLVADGYDFDLDRVFDFGLQRLLDGFATILEPTPR